MDEKKVYSEEFHVSGEELLAKIKELIRQGDIRRIIIKDQNGKIIVDIPLTLGVVGAILAPQLAALGAIAALVSPITIAIEREEKS